MGCKQSKEVKEPQVFSNRQIAASEPLAVALESAAHEREVSPPKSPTVPSPGPATAITLQSQDPQNEPAEEIRESSHVALSARPLNSEGEPVSVTLQLASTDDKENQPVRKVAFDAAAIKHSAPKAQNLPKSLTKKQKTLCLRNHVSEGRAGPVASKFTRGARGQMRPDIYLEMTRAFERTLTNVDTLSAHLDTR